eukprot:2222875-Prymnesium_polylepis.1
MFTGWPSATGFAAPDCMCGLGEQHRRQLIGRRLGVDDRACRRQLGTLEGVNLAECISHGPLRGPREAMP